MAALVTRFAQDRSPFEGCAAGNGNHADELRTVLALKVRARTERAADERLAHRCHAAEAEIVQRGAAVELRPADMAFLHPQGAKRFEAIGSAAARFRASEQSAPQGAAVVGMNVDFVSQLAREADACDAARHA